MEDLKQLQQEVDEMSKVMDNPGYSDPVTETPSTESPSTEVPETEVPSTETPNTETPPTEPPTTEAPKSDEKDRVIEELRKKIAELESAKKPSPQTPAPTTEAPILEIDFIGDLDLDDLTRDPDEFNKLLNKIYKKGVEYAREEAKRYGETVIKSIPDIVKSNIVLANRLKQIHDKFYEENKDLVPWKKVVGAVFEELLAENPDKSYEELLPQVAAETRKRLELHKKAQPKPGKGRPPSLPRKKGGPRQTTKPDPNPLLQEIAEMDKALGY